jgi:ParB-like chromosome segregation protein Spo0J
MEIRDRIKELRRVPASLLRANPRNWRTHPVAQREALRGVLAEIGFATALVARELEDGTLELIDGHLRAETAPDALLPVLVLDVTEEEAAKLLLTLDPVAALAGTDQAQLGELLAMTEFANPQLDGLLGELAAAADAAFEETTHRAEVTIPESFQVVVQCESEADQQSVYERMRAEGRRCRVLTL